MNTKIELNHNKITRVRDLSDLAIILFPHNKRHQKVYLAIYIELKYATNQSLPTLAWIAEKYHFSHRLLEIVRAKMRRMGIIDHISKFSKKNNYQEAWVFSSRFQRTLSRLAEYHVSFSRIENSRQEQKDRDLFRYL